MRDPPPVNICSGPISLGIRKVEKIRSEQLPGGLAGSIPTHMLGWVDSPRATLWPDVPQSNSIIIKNKMRPFCIRGVQEY